MNEKQAIAYANALSPENFSSATSHAQARKEWLKDQSKKYFYADKSKCCNRGHKNPPRWSRNGSCVICSRIPARVSAGHVRSNPRKIQDPLPDEIEQQAYCQRWAK